MANGNLGILGNASISDLFFNTDHSDAIVKVESENGNLVDRHDRNKIIAKADQFNDCMKEVIASCDGDVEKLPSSTQLADEFFSRI